MTPDEREMLTDLAKKIAQTPTPALDPQADEFIRANIGNRAEAMYILTQTVLIQNLALQHAQREIEELKQRAAAPPQASTSFLGGLLHGGPHAVAPQPSAPPQPQPQYSAPASEAPGFLRSAAQTAAGVAAGALAFEGIRALFGGGFAGWGRPQAGSFLTGAPVGETIINNYYDARESPESQDDGSAQAAAAGDSSDADIANDSDDAADDADRSDDTDSSFADATDYSDDSGSSGDDFA